MDTRMRLTYIGVILIIILLVGVGSAYLIITRGSPSESQSVTNENNDSYDREEEGDNENNDPYYPCGEGYVLLGDICEPTPEGYVETRTPCEMGVESREAAGVEQDFQAELAKCREG